MVKKDILDKELRTPIFMTNEEIDMWKWVCQNYKILDITRKLRLGSATFNCNIGGEIKASWTIHSLRNGKMPE